MLRLKNEVKIFLEDKEENSIEINDFLLIKNKVSDNTVVLLGTNNKNNCFYYNFCNQLIFDTNKNEILFVFATAFFQLFKNDESQVLKEINSYKNVKTELQKTVKKEFDSILSEISLEKELLVDPVVENMAKDALNNHSVLEYEIPLSVYNDISFTYSVLSEVQKDIYDYSYNLMEKYLAHNPAYLRECQRIYAAKILYNKMTGMLSEEEKEKNEILMILQDSQYKSLKIKYRTNDGKVLESSFKTAQLNINTFPYWIIEEISYNRKTLYKCSIKNIYKWEHNKEEILSKILAMNYYSLQKDEKFFLSWFPKDMLTDEEVVIGILKTNARILLKLKDISEFDLEFFEHVSKKIENYSLTLFTHQLLRDSSLLNDKSFVLSLISYGYEIYPYLSKELAYDIDVLKACLKKDMWVQGFFSNKDTIANLTFNEQKELVEFMDDLANKGNEKILLNNIENEELIKECITNIEFAKMQCICHKKIFDFKYVNVDESFILEVLKEGTIATVFVYNRYIANNDFYDSMPSRFKRNKIIAKEFIKQGLQYHITNKDFYDNFWFAFDSLDEIFDTIKISKRNHFLVNFLNLAEQLKLIDDYPEILCYVFSNKDSSKLYEVLTTSKFEFLKEVAIKNSIDFPWSMLDKTQILEILKQDFSVAAFIPNYQLNNQNIVDYLSDKMFILDKIVNKDYYNDFKTHPFDDKNFLRKQSKFNSADILSYIPKSTKVLNPYSLQGDKDFVLELIHLNSKNIYGLDKNSSFFKDLDFASVVLELEPESYYLFGKRVLSNKNLKEELKTKLSEEDFSKIFS